MGLSPSLIFVRRRAAKSHKCRSASRCQVVEWSLRRSQKLPRELRTYGFNSKEDDCNIRANLGQQERQFRNLDAVFESLFHCSSSAGRHHGSLARVANTQALVRVLGLPEKRKAGCSFEHPASRETTAYRFCSTILLPSLPRSHQSPAITASDSRATEPRKCSFGACCEQAGYE